LQWRIDFADEDAARDGEAAARVALYVLREAVGRLPREIRVSGQATPKLTAFVRDVQAALRSAPLERRGTTLEGSLTLKTDEATLKPFLTEMDRLAAKMEGQNNIKQIGLAMHNYEASYGVFPNAAICDREGKPLLSWRVAILPFLDEENVYKQFNFNEPWDGPTNIKLLDKMPKAYALPNRPAKGNGETFLRVFTGPDTAFDLKRGRPGPGSFGLRIADITDGTSNTLMVVEAAESVPWTKPDDLPFDPKKPLPKLGGTYPDKFFALFFDGSVRTIRTNLPADVLRALITPRGGEVVDYDSLEPGETRPPQRSGESDRPKPPPEPDRVKPDRVNPPPPPDRRP
jgi:hypothetical protein